MQLWNQEKADQLIPEHMRGGLRRYIEQGIRPGNFLCAVLSNNLKDACGYGDSINLGCLPNYIRYLYNHAPSTCWGSPEKYEAWIKMHEDQLVR